jgi:hypothetical protein
MMSDPETRAARRIGMAELDLGLSGRGTTSLDEDGRPVTPENEMVEPADQEDLEFRETGGSAGPETTDPDRGPTPLVAPEERAETVDQVRTGGGGQATPDDLPDAPVPWQRSDARPMEPAEKSSDR